MNKADIIKEVERLHKEYEEEGGKLIKPSFKYILVLESFNSKYDEAYYVSNEIEEICTKALTLINLGNFGTIYEIVRSPNGYVCEEIYKLDELRREIIPSQRWAHELPMHVAWKTRGDCLNEDIGEV